MVIFDYIFFRVAKYFFKKDGSNAQRAFAVVTIVQTLLIGELFFTLDRYLLVTKISGDTAKFVGIVIAGILLFLNHLRYQGKYFSYRVRWVENENLRAYIVKGFLVIAAILLPCFMMLLMTDNPLFDKLF